jgi:hypothetical protein
MGDDREGNEKRQISPSDSRISCCRPAPFPRVPCPITLPRPEAVMAPEGPVNGHGGRYFFLTRVAYKLNSVQRIASVESDDAGGNGLRNHL